MAKLKTLELSPILGQKGVAQGTSSVRAGLKVIGCLDSEGKTHFLPRQIVQLCGGITMNGEEIVGAKSFACKVHISDIGEKFKARDDSSQTNREFNENSENPLSSEDFLKMRIKELKAAKCERHTPLPTDLDLSTDEGQEALEEWMNFPLFEEGDEDVYHSERVIGYASA